MRALIGMLVLSAAMLQGSKALAQTYDYQGLLMTGTGNSHETFTAALTFFGPVTDPNTALNVQFTISGTDVNRAYNINGCTISGCTGELNPVDFTVNTSGGIFKSADILLGDGEYGLDGQDGSTEAYIGPQGDSLEIDDFYGHLVLSVANATPGTWTEAPEMDADSLGTAVTLLACGLAMFSRRGRSQDRQWIPVRRTSAPSPPSS